MSEMIYTAEDAQRVKSEGKRMVKKTPTYVIPIPGPCTVRTEEGSILVNEDGYLATNEEADRVWPISKDYIEKNYTEA